MSELLRAARAGERPVGLEIIDMHAHLGVTNFTIPDLSPASIVASMDRLGVAQAVISHMACMSADAERGNREVQAALEAYPGRLLGYMSVWPFSGAWVEQEAEYWLAQRGFVGIKLHNSTGFPYTHEAYAPLYAVAQERRLPVLLHTWGGEQEFAQVRALAERYPEAVFLLAHSGSNSEAGYLQIARDCPHVFLDTTLSTARRGLIERLVEGAGAEKVVWGSDVYFLNQAQQLGKVLGAKLTGEKAALVLRGNARVILGRIRV